MLRALPRPGSVYQADCLRYNHLEMTAFCTEELPLFVFGTLRRGESNHHYLAGFYDRWLPAALRDFKRTVTDHGFPCVAPSAGSQVVGELFFFRRQVFVETLRN